MLLEERKKSKEKDREIKKLEDEVRVQRLHVKVLQKRQQPVLQEAERELSYMRIAKARLECQVKRLERKLREAQAKIAEYQELLKEPNN